MKIPERAPVQFNARRVGQACMIPVGNREISAIFLGRGRFTNAFLDVIKEDVYLWTHYGDLSKEIISHCNTLKHIPKVERIEAYRQVFDKAEHLVRVYRTRYYDKLTAKYHPQAYYWAKQIRKARFEAAIKHGDIRSTEFSNRDCYLENQFVVDRIRGTVPESLVLALQEINDVSAHYDGYLFDDFNPRNCGIGRNGELIFLDALFSAKIVRDDIIIRDLENTIGGYKKSI